MHLILLLQFNQKIEVIVQNKIWLFLKNKIDCKHKKYKAYEVVESQ